MKVLNLHDRLQCSRKCDIHVEVSNKQQKLFWIVIIKQGNFKILEVRLIWRRSTIQFQFNKIMFRLIIMINFYQGDWWRLHMHLYHPNVPLILVGKITHGSSDWFEFVLLRQFLCKVSYNLSS